MLCTYYFKNLFLIYNSSSSSFLDIIISYDSNKSLSIHSFSIFLKNKTT